MSIETISENQARPTVEVWVEVSSDESLIISIFWIFPIRKNAARGSKKMLFSSISVFQLRFCWLRNAVNRKNIEFDNRDESLKGAYLVNFGLSKLKCKDKNQYVIIETTVYKLERFNWKLNRKNQASSYGDVSVGNWALMLMTFFGISIP